MKMKKPELNVIRFDSNDVIATSGTPVEPVYLMLSNVGNGDGRDNLMTVLNGPYNGKSQQNARQNNIALTAGLTLANNAYGVDYIKQDTQFWRADHADYITFANLYCRPDRDGFSTQFNGKYIFVDNDYTIEFQQVGQTN